MFYSQDILQKRGGKFGIIWIAATRAVQLSRRDYSAVHIRRTCEDIIKYITLQQQVDAQGMRPRFSLYLSSQLMFGICRVFRKQHEYLSADVTSLWLNCTSSHISTANIDLHIKRSYETTCPSPLTVIGKGLSSVGFGTFRDYAEMQLKDLPDFDYWTYEEGLYDSFGSISPDALINRPDIPLPRESPPTPTALRFQATRDSPLQLPNKSITLTDGEEHLRLSNQVQVPGEKDLPPLSTDFYELPMEAKDLSSSDLADISADHLTLPLQPPIPEEFNLFDAGDHVQAQLQEVPITTEEAMAVQQEGMMAPTEETPAVLIDPDQLELLERPRVQPPRSPDVTPVPGVKESRAEKRKRLRMQLIPIEEQADTPRRKRARRFNLLIDAVTQIPHRQFREQLNQGSETCWDEIEIADPTCVPKQHIFKTPHSKEIKENPLFRRMWNRNLRTRGVPMTDDVRDDIWTVPTDSSSSDNDSPRLELRTLEDISLEEDMALGVPPVEQPVLESALEAIRDASISHIELPRDASHSRLDSMGLQDITPAHTTGLSRSHDSSLLTSFDTESASKSRRRFSESLHEAVQQEPIMESYIEEFPLYQIPEDLEMQALNQETPAAHPPQETGPPEQQLQPTPPIPSRVEHGLALDSDTSLPAHHRLIKAIKKCTKNNQLTKFHEICPFTMSGSQAAILFSALLDICALQRVAVSQVEPYSEIIIRRGTKW